MSTQAAAPAVGLVGEPAPAHRPRLWTPGATALRDAWFPLAHSRHVRDKRHPLRRFVHGQPCFLWREGGALHASEFHPASTGTPREAGELSGGSGRYPVHERYAVVWAWIGNPHAADEKLVPDVPFLPAQGGMPRFMSGTIIFDSCADLCVENLLDLTHSDYVHTNVLGDELCDDDRISVDSTSETVTMVRERKNMPTSPLMRIAGVKTKVQDYRAVIHVHLRSHLVVGCATYTPGLAVPLFHPNTPESHFRTRVSFSTNTLGSPLLFKYLFPPAAYMVGPQDNGMLRPQNPRYLQRNERPDLHSRFDRACTKFRFLMQQQADRQLRGDYAYLPDADPGADISDLLRFKRVH